MQSLINYVKNPRLIGLGFVKKVAKFISNDKLYLQLRYYFETGNWLNLKNPETFNEKLNWLKLFNREPEYVLMVDKYAVKAYVAEQIGEKYVIPTYAVWDSPEEIDFGVLPDQFVLKTTHGGGGNGVLICRDKSTFDKELAIKKLSKAMHTDIYANYREWPYKGVPRKIIAEKYLVDESNVEMKDYKFFCFNGKVEFCKVDFGRFVEHHANYYTPDWNILPFGESVCAPDLNQHIDRPSNLGTMLEVAEKLAKAIPFVRIDLYNANGHVYFGEITFYPAGGMGKFIPESADLEIGRLLKLPI